MEEFERVRVRPPAPPIWQKQCRNHGGRNQPGWFSKSTHSYCKNDAKTNYCRQSSVGKPPSLMRLSSTGDTVEETTAEFRNFDPSNPNIRGGSESNLRLAGIFDRFTKFAASATSNISRGSSMSLTSNLPGKVRVENGVDLNVLIEKFDPSKVEMECRQFGNAWVAPPAACPQQQWGMNGFVKEGVYHPFQKRMNYPFVPDRQPITEASRFLNVGPSNQVHNCRHQTHPYLRWNQHTCMPKRHPPVTSYSVCHHLDSISCNPLLASPGTPQSHTCTIRAKITDSILFRDKFVDPKIQPRMQSPEAFGKDVKGHCGGHRNHVMKQQSMMSHTCRQKQNKSPGYVSSMPNTGNPNQLNKSRTPNRSKNTQKKHNCNSSKSGKPRTVSGCFHSNTKSPEHVNNSNTSKHSVEKLVSGEMVEQFVKTSVDNNQPGQELEIKVKGRTELKAKQAEELESNITSSVVDESRGKNYHVTAEPESVQGIEAKSNDKETCSTTQIASCDKSKQLCDLNINNTDEDKVLKEFSPPQDKPSKDSSTNLDFTSSSKPLHATLAYILAETVFDDFSDSDWDVEDSLPSSDSWNFNCWNDPYNPLYGWKCESYSNKQATPEPAKQDSSLKDDELDSGIYSLQAQQDEADSMSDKYSESDEWNEEDSTCSTKISSSSEKSFSVSRDGWEGLTAQSNSTNSTADETKRAGLNSHVQSPENGEDLNVSVKPSESSRLIEKDENISSPPSKSSMLHPSVLFILGIDETDSDLDDDDDDDDDFDNCSSDLNLDVSWDPVQGIHDPFNPLQGWKCMVTTPVKFPAATIPPITITCEGPKPNNPSKNIDSLQEIAVSLREIADSFQETVDSLQETTDSVPETIRRMLVITAPSKVVGKPTLKHAASTGCLRNLSEKWRSGSSNVVKKVHFCEASPIFVSPEIPMWMSEYSASRRGPWEEMARDRCRFMHRIRTMGEMIGHVFKPEHRERVQKRLEAC